MAYNKEAVGQAIASSNRAGRRINGKEAKAIHALLKGSTGYAARLARRDAAILERQG